MRNSKVVPSSVELSRLNGVKRGTLNKLGIDLSELPNCINNNKQSSNACTTLLLPDALAPKIPKVGKTSISQPSSTYAGAISLSDLMCLRLPFSLD